MSLEEATEGAWAFESRLGRSLEDMGVVLVVSPHPQKPPLSGAGFVGKAKAAFYPRSRRLVLIASRLADARDLEATLRHELLAHHGINLLAPTEKRAFPDVLLETRSKHGFAAAWAHVDETYPDAPEDIKAEELLAYVAENPSGPLQAAFDWVARQVRQLLRRFG